MHRISRPRVRGFIGHMTIPKRSLSLPERLFYLLLVFPLRIASNVTTCPKRWQVVPTGDRPKTLNFLSASSLLATTLIIRTCSGCRCPIQVVMRWLRRCPSDLSFGAQEGTNKDNDEAAGLVVDSLALGRHLKKYCLPKERALLVTDAVFQETEGFLLREFLDVRNIDHLDLSDALLGRHGHGLSTFSPSSKRGKRSITDQ